MAPALFKTSLLALATAGNAANVAISWDLRNWMVDYQRPTIAPRVAPFDLPRDCVTDSLLANNSFPGPAIDVFEGDTVELTVINDLIDYQVKIDFEGVKVQKAPESPILQQGGRFKYELLADKAGIFKWQASSPLQAAQGLKGALIVKSKNDPLAGKYQEEQTLVISDARQRPQICMESAGAIVKGCPEVDKATINGQWGDDSKGWPRPVPLVVTKGQCYKLNFVGLQSQLAAGQFHVSIDDHKLQILKGGKLVEVPQVDLTLEESGVAGIVCADQSAKDYLIRIAYDGTTGSSQEFTATMRYGGNWIPALSVPEAEAVQHPAMKGMPMKVQTYGSVGREKFDMKQCDRTYIYDLREHIVDFLRPTTEPRKKPEDVPLANRKAALLVNNSYPGPVLEGIEGELLCVIVNNNFEEDPVSIHWHGQHMKGFPAFDGVYGVTQAAIGPKGGSMVYRWRANKGTHFYHGHMQALQADRGLKGPIVIHAKNDPHKHLYDEERVVTLSDEWVNPGTCLRVEGAQPGNPVCQEIQKGAWNGQWGDGSADYPWPKLTVEKGKCYRFRFIGMMGQTQNFLISMAGHDMTLIALDGEDLEPVKVSTFNLHAGERADIVVCANQEPGNYLISAVYDLATFLETAPAPKLPRVESSKYWAFLNYKGHTEEPPKPTKKLLGGYNAPPGTGGGKSPGKVNGFVFDTNQRSSWTKVRPLVPEPEKEKADVTYVMDVGVSHPSFKPGETPYATTDKMYMFTEIKSWQKPDTPLLHTKGKCGADSTPFITVPENATTVEVIINNLSPTAHVLHMHGMTFSVINYAPFSETWCSAAHFDCFFIPIKVGKLLDCKGARLGDPNRDGPGSEYWGCPYDGEKDEKLRNLQAPLKKDMISLWRRSWAVIRFKVENPGTWLFHCHMEQHIPTGQVMAFNLLPSKQPPIPDDVPTEGECKVWSGREAPLRLPKENADVFV
eukprot:TRINITY_DN63635_c0_g1_i1.p1 TRINITY_DN63635_c0_g1~~TRINITY_DN63635_c0_g1_i1.p1  ORF type:complete len:956 (-),score=217.94 TRINITY_DN63635_c0_g1_i1:385-3252(-)